MPRGIGQGRQDLYLTQKKAPAQRDMRQTGALVFPQVDGLPQASLSHDLSRPGVGAPGFCSHGTTPSRASKRADDARLAVDDLDMPLGRALVEHRTPEEPARGTVRAALALRAPRRVDGSHRLGCAPRPHSCLERSCSSCGSSTPSHAATMPMIAARARTTKIPIHPITTAPRS